MREKDDLDEALRYLEDVRLRLVYEAYGPSCPTNLPDAVDSLDKAVDFIRKARLKEGSTRKECWR